MNVGKKPRILCMNREEAALMIRKLVLESYGYEILTATHAQEALRIIRSQSIDLVIADHFLRDTVGTDVAAKIKYERPSLPIILLSGAVDPPEDIQNVNMFVSKAEGRERLLDAISRFVSRPKAA
jgi:CheY-like chemotaxis protein